MRAWPCFCNSALQGKGVTCSKKNLTPIGRDDEKKQHSVMPKNNVPWRLCGFVRSLLILRPADLEFDLKKFKSVDFSPSLHLKAPCGWTAYMTLLHFLGVGHDG